MIKRIELAVSGVLLMLCCGTSWAAEEPAAQLILHIESQLMGTALKELADRTGLQLVYPDEVVDPTLMAPALEGKFTPAAALAQLLAGSGLSYHFINPQTVAIRSGEDKSGAGTSKTSAVAPLQDGTVLRLAQSSDAPASVGNESEAPAAPSSESLVLEEVVVTGTNIRGIAPAGSALQVYDKVDFERSGYTTTEQFIESLPQNTATVSADPLSFTGDGSSNITFGTTVNLRGLGADTTLVLLNGRRLPRAGDGGQLVDISMLPLTALERVEVLTDGASAIYGSDAVAGVVNFVLRRDYQGAETRLRYGSVTSGSSDEYRIAQTFGRTVGSTNVLASYEYYNRGALRLSDRDLPASPFYDGSTWLLPEQKRHSLLLALHSRRSDALELSFEGTYANSDGRNFADFFGLNSDSRTSVEQATFAGGLEYALVGNWRARLSGSVGRVKSERTRSIDGLLQLDTQPEFKLAGAEAVVDGPLVTLGGGNAKVAMGASFNRESFDQSDIVATGSAGVSDRRNIRAAFAELNLPFVSAVNSRPGIAALNAVVALRYESYSDFGSAVSPKAGLLWSPVEGLRIRGTVGRSFKAPSFNELGLGIGVILADFPDDSAPSGSRLALQYAGGNADLDAEKGKTWTAGIDLEPRGWPWLALSATYFNIDYDKRIDFIPGAFDSLNNLAVYAPFVTLAPTPQQIDAVLALDSDVPEDFSIGQLGNFEDAQAIIFGGYTNLSSSRVDGVDFNLNARFSAGPLRYGGSISASRLLHGENQLIPGTSFLSALDRPQLPVDLRVRGQAFIETDAVHASLSANFTDSYRNDRDIAPATIGSWLVFDANLSFFPGAGRSSSALAGTKITLSANNLFDEDPPRFNDLLDFAFPGYDTVNASPLGRLIALEVSKSWGAARE